MFKKLVCCCALFVGMSAVDAVAAPTIRKTTTVAPLATVGTQKQMGSLGRASVTTKAAKIPTTKAVSVNPRTSILTKSLKKIKLSSNDNYNANNNNNNSNNNNNNNVVQPAPTGASTEDLENLTNRVETLEDNMITDVITEEGTYVTDVALDGDKIYVEKTRALHAPIRQEGTGDITGNAEIWIVK